MNSEHQSPSLVRSTLVSLVIAIMALLFFILPAEYGIDPTGLGQKLGLTVFQETNEGNTSPITQTTSSGEDTVVLTVPAGIGIEYKLFMEQHQKVTYEWVTDSRSLYVDLHGEPKGDTTGYFESYSIATVPQMKGSFIAPFAGSHGWYWKNNSSKDIQVQLIFSGSYTIEGLK